MTELTEQQARQWGMFAHLSALSIFIGIPFGNLLGPFIIWILKKDEHPFIHDQVREALNFQLSLTIYAAVSGILLLLAVGLFLLIIIGLAAIVFPVVAAFKASEGASYRYPVTIRFLS